MSRCPGLSPVGWGWGGSQPGTSILRCEPVGSLAWSDSLDPLPAPALCFAGFPASPGQFQCFGYVSWYPYAVRVSPLFPLRLPVMSSWGPPSPRWWHGLPAPCMPSRSCPASAGQELARGMVDGPLRSETKGGTLFQEDRGSVGPLRVGS